MDRKRRFDCEEQAQSVAVPSIDAFIATLGNLSASLELASLLDVYCVYVAFLRGGYSVNVEVSHGQFYRLEVSKPKTASETVIPIRLSYPSFTMQLLDGLLEKRGHVSLAWVSDDGAFTMHGAVRGIIPPMEKFKDGTEEMRKI